VFNAFRKLQDQPGYRMRMVMESNDPRMAQMAAQGMGFGAMEKIVKGNTTQTSMHMKIPAMDVRGVIDDWEIRAVFQNGRGARLITSPAVPRILKYGDQMLAMQMAMMERQSASVIAQAAAQGPIGALSAGLAAGDMAMAAVEASLLSKKAHEFYSWQCLDQPAGRAADSKKTTNLLTDLKSLGEESVDGTPANAYEFYTRDGDQLRGPVHMDVTKDSGLPLRIAMTDPGGHGSMHMDYTDFGKVPDIEIPDCLKGQQ